MFFFRSDNQVVLLTPQWTLPPVSNAATLSLSVRIFGSGVDLLYLPLKPQTVHSVQCEICLVLDLYSSRPSHKQNNQFLFKSSLDSSTVSPILVTSPIGRTVQRYLHMGGWTRSDQGTPPQAWPVGTCWQDRGWCRLSLLVSNTSVFGQRI